MKNMIDETGYDATILHLLRAVQTVKTNGEVTFTSATDLETAMLALASLPKLCRDDCKLKYRNCNGCARNYRKMKDCYEPLDVNNVDN